jgi:thiamine biosynthesis lipoprotein ApbE
MIPILLFALQDEVFLTEEKALELLFGEQAVVCRGILNLTPEQEKAIETRLGRDIPGSHPVWVAADGEGRTIGFAMVWEEIGKYKPITFMVGAQPDGKVKGVYIMVYREPIGSDVRKEWWRSQFPGKSTRDPIKRDRDISKITGATMSCDAVCLGVRKALAMIDAGLVKTPENAAKILQAQPKNKPVKLQQVVMGTTCTIEAYAEDRAAAERAIAKAFEELHRLDALLSNYKEDSELSRMNREAGGKDFEASEGLAEFVRICLEMARASEGGFDPTVEPAVRLWGFFDHKFKVPEPEALQRVRAFVGFDKVKLDGRRIRFDRPGMALDPGGIGKGYALDRAANILAEAGIRSAILDFGTSSLRAVGSPPGEEGWTVGIRHPEEPTRIVARVRLRDASLSTSSPMGNWFEEGGKKYGHILDPSTCEPVQMSGSITVIHPDGARADAASTALVVRGMALAAGLGVEALRISVDKSVTLEPTDGFRRYMISEK